MPSNGKKDNRPDVPTRLNENGTDTGDRFETLVYHYPDPDLFLTLDQIAEPDAYDWIVTELHDGRVVMEIYDGQDFIGTANLLEFYKLQNSEQWRPKIRNRFID